MHPFCSCRCPRWDLRLTLAYLGQMLHTGPASSSAKWDPEVPTSLGLGSPVQPPPAPTPGKGSVQHKPATCSHGSDNFQNTGTGDLKDGGEKRKGECSHLWLVRGSVRFRSTGAASEPRALLLEPGPRLPSARPPWRHLGITWAAAPSPTDPPNWVRRSTAQRLC